MKIIDQLDFNFQNDSTAFQKEFFDRLYNEFIHACNGGGYFSSSIIFYGYQANIQCYDIDMVNESLQENYGNIFRSLYSIGCDIFGNQFVFNVDNKVNSFNIETGETSFLSENFQDFLSLLEEDGDYLSGYPYMEAWMEVNGSLKIENRLLPNKPFVIGGEYTIENMIAYDYLELIKYNSKIARQIFDLPDGQPIQIKWS